MWCTKCEEETAVWKGILSCWIERSRHCQIGSHPLPPPGFPSPSWEKTPAPGEWITAPFPRTFKGRWISISKAPAHSCHLQFSPLFTLKSHTTSPRSLPQDSRRSLSSPRSDTTLSSLPRLFWDHTAFATKRPTSYHPLPWSPITVTQASPPDFPTQHSVCLPSPLNSASIFCLSSTCHTWEPQPFHIRQFTIFCLKQLRAQHANTAHHHLCQFAMETCWMEIWNNQTA